MSMLVFAVYWSPPQPESSLIGLDYIQLHRRRMQFARDALFGPEQVLPAWYPRELLGTPFWSNIQNFPFIPTRLLMLVMDPSGPYAYAVAVLLSAWLAALFSYLYLRSIGLGRMGSAAGGWTFACSGYYASRVAAGHLPLLEAYPALPLLMWIVESLIQAQQRGEKKHYWVGAAAIGTASVILAGHPQLPAYAIVTAWLYSLWRGRNRAALWAGSAMALGIGISAFALAPMILLVARSTRVLALAPPLNDVSMPYSRLLAFFLPWHHGAPPLLNPDKPFQGYPSLAYFWDTVSYVGVLPWAALLLLAASAYRGNWTGIPKRAGAFVVLSGLIGIVLSLPFVDYFTSLLPGTIFRSPARIIYISEFALAVALGVGVHAALAAGESRTTRMVVLLLLTVHGMDLGGHDRRFILRGPVNLPPAEMNIVAEALKEVGAGRVGMDYAIALPVNRMVDDVGFFDSIMLARPYQLVLSLANAPQKANIQTFNGAELDARALAALGVKLLFTTATRADLPSKGQIHSMKLYSVPSPSPRAEFFALSRVRILPSTQIHAALRDPGVELRSWLLLPQEAANAAPPAAVASLQGDATVEYRRPDSDHIECIVTAPRSGYLRVLESWDPGWSATVDGSPLPVVPAMDALLAVPITPGHHEVRFVYRTPGAAAGSLVSIISLALLCGLLRMASRSNQKALRSESHHGFKA
jgi:hypothetical protein